MLKPANRKGRDDQWDIWWHGCKTTSGSIPSKPIPVHFAQTMIWGCKAEHFFTVNQPANTLLPNMSAQGGIMRRMNQKTLHNRHNQSRMTTFRKPEKCAQAGRDFMVSGFYILVRFQDGYSISDILIYLLKNQLWTNRDTSNGLFLNPSMQRQSHRVCKRLTGSLNSTKIAKSRFHDTSHKSISLRYTGRW